MAFALAWTLSATPVSAGVLTCATFKVRLDDALAAAGMARGAMTFETIRRLDARVWQISWRGAGLSGRLTCADADAFADFYMAIDAIAPRAAGVPSDLKTFNAIGAASICALSSGPTEACRTLMTTMTTESVDHYREDVHDGDDRPQGLRDYAIVPKVDAVLLLDPQAMSWAIGPGVAARVADERVPLAARERDEDE